MALSARNQITGTVRSIKKDAVMAEVIVELKGGDEVVSVITASSAERLGIAEGKEVTVVIKSTEVMLSSS